MKKLVIFLIILIVILSFAVYLLIPKHKQNIVKEVQKVRTKEYRSLTIINKTSEHLIRECILTTAEGLLVARQEKLTESNIVFADFDSNGSFSDEKSFKVTLIDRYGLKYEKIFEAKEKGNTDVSIDDKNYVSQDGDWFKKVMRFFNK